MLMGLHSMVACLSTSLIDRVQLGHTALVLEKENIFTSTTPAHPEQSPLLMKLYARTTTGHMINDISMIPQAEDCSIEPWQVASDANDALFFSYACHRHGIKNIKTYLQRGNQSIILPDIKNVIQVLTPENGQPTFPAGQSLLLQVVAQQENNQMYWDYEGTVQILSSDPLATLPQPYTFERENDGVHTFTENVVLKSSGQHTIHFVDHANQDVHFPTKQLQITPKKPSQIIVSDIQQAYLSTSPIAFDLHIADEFGSSVDFTGTLRLTGSALSTGIEHTLSLQADQPYRVPNFFITQIGTYRITLEAIPSDPSLPPINPMTLLLTIEPGVARYLHILPDSIHSVAGQPLLLQCMIEDEFGNLITSYSGQIELTSSDQQTSMKIASFTANNQGIVFLAMPLLTAGTQTIGVSWPNDIQSKNVVEIEVVAGVGRFTTLDAPSTVIAGQNFTLSVAFLDLYGNQTMPPVGSYRWVASANAGNDSDFFQFDLQGQAQITMNLALMDRYQITIENTQNSSLTSEIQTIDVIASSCAQTQWQQVKRRVGWQESINATLLLQDSFGNDCISSDLYRLESTVGADNPTLPADLTLPANNRIATTFSFSTTGIRQLIVRNQNTNQPLQNSFEFEVLRVERLLGYEGISPQHCAQLSNMDTHCWGNNASGTLGVGDSISRGLSPSHMGDFLPRMQLPQGTHVLHLAFNDSQICAVLNDNRLTCFGMNVDGWRGPIGIYPQQVGDGAMILPVLNGEPVVHVAVGQQNQVCAITMSGRLSCWGGSPTTLGIPGSNWWEIRPSSNNFEINLGVGRRATQVSLAGTLDYTSHHCVILDNQTMKCWGHAGLGHLGYGDWSHRYNVSGPAANLPVVPVGTNRLTLQVSTTGFATITLLDNGQVKNVGRGTDEPSGYGDAIFRGYSWDTVGDNLPAIQFAVPNPVKKIASSNDNVCVLFDHGQVQCWGRNGSGELGLGDTQERGKTSRPNSYPLVNLGTNRWARDLNNFCVLLDTYEVRCWGGNYYGELGAGDIISRGGSPGQMGDALAKVRFW